MKNGKRFSSQIEKFQFNQNREWESEIIGWNFSFSTRKSPWRLLCLAILENGDNDNNDDDWKKFIKDLLFSLAWKEWNGKETTIWKGKISLENKFKLIEQLKKFSFLFLNFLLNIIIIYHILVN